MRRVCGEPLHLLKRRLKPPDHLVEGGGKTGDLSWGPVQVEAEAEILSFDLLRQLYDFLKGLIVAAENDFMQAEELFHRSARDDEEVGAVVPAAQTRYYLARMLARKGDVDRARELLAKLEKHFREWIIPVWEGKCRQAITELPKHE